MTENEKPIKRSDKRKNDKSTKKINWLRAFIIACLVGAVLFAGVAAAFVITTIKNMPDMSGLMSELSASTYIYNEDGTELIAALHQLENREIIDLEDIPQVVQDAFIAVEDERFETHKGIDIKGIFRAVYANILSMSKGQGASTITQQLARNAYLTQDKNFTRKFTEWIYALQLERIYEKDQILEMYLNQVYLGYNTHGVQTAALHYFDKDAADLTLPEASLLAGITKGPNWYYPYNHMDRAKMRQQIVLDLMVEQEMVTQEEADIAYEEELNLAEHNENYNYAYFVDYVLSELLETYGPETVYNGGLRVYTTINTKAQLEAEAAVFEIMDDAFPPNDGEYQPQTGAVMIDPTNGYLQAIVGGRTYDQQLGLNRALRPRQPGSAFKPIAVFAPAIEYGYSPSSIFFDQQVSISTGTSTWSPSNYNDRYLGPMSLREAAARSINTIPAQIIKEIGVDMAIRYAQDMGITTLELENTSINDYSLAIALGGLTNGVSPLELASAYGVFATGGKYAEPMAIIRVEDANGRILEENTPQVRQVLDPAVCYLVTDMLKGAVNQPFGTAGRGNIGRPVACKTGTTNNDYDAWFVGYTPNMTGAVWIGHDYPKQMHQIYGGGYPAKIWNRTIKAALSDRPALNFTVPSGLVSQTVCATSGMLPGPHCPESDIRSEIFLAGNAPTTTCSVHQEIQICTQSGKIARTGCPITHSLIIEVWPPEFEYIAPGTPTEMCDLHTDIITPPDDIPWIDDEEPIEGEDEPLGEETPEAEEDEPEPSEDSEGE